MEQLEAEGYFYPDEREIMTPDILIFTNKRMKYYYMLYGQCTRFSLSLRYEKFKSKRGGAYYKGFFIGMNNNLKMVPFAIVLSDCENTEAYERIFSGFFQLMDGKQPEVLMTDRNQMIVDSLAELETECKWLGTHLFDPWNIL